MTRWTWLGHSAVRLQTNDGKVLLIDPFLSRNPRCPEALRAPERVDAILLTHAHSDHARPGHGRSIVARDGAPDARRDEALLREIPRIDRFASALVVITAGVPFGTPGATNILRIAWVE